MFVANLPHKAESVIDNKKLKTRIKSWISFEKSYFEEME